MNNNSLENEREIEVDSTRATGTVVNGLNYTTITIGGKDYLVLYSVGNKVASSISPVLV